MNLIAVVVNYYIADGIDRGNLKEIWDYFNELSGLEEHLMKRKTSVTKKINKDKKMKQYEDPKPFWIKLMD